MISEEIMDKTTVTKKPQVQSDNTETGMADLPRNQTCKRPLFATIIMLLMYLYAVVFVVGGVIAATHVWHYNKGQSLMMLLFEVMFGLLHLSIGFAFKDGEKWGRRMISFFCFLIVLEFYLATVRNGTPMVSGPLGMFWALPCFLIWVLGFFDPLRGWMQKSKLSTSGQRLVRQQGEPPTE